MNYRFDDLGWSQFERLCQAVLSSRYGLAVEAWGGSGDWGRDAWSEGPLAFPLPTGPYEPGPFLFQCKFVENSQAVGAKRALERLAASLREEARRIVERVADGWSPPAHYVVMTNARVPDRSRGQVLSKLSGVLPGETRLHLVPGQDLEMLVTGLPDVRLSFPQLLGVSDLKALMQETLDRELLTRSNDLLATASRLAEVYVPSEAHQQVVRALLTHGFAVLTGPPEAGKTSIARMIALAQGTAGWQIVDTSRGPGVFDRQYRLDRRQLFVADDAFGSTEFRPDFAREWEEAFPRVFRALGSTHWLIWVSRSAPLRAALSRISLREEAEAFPDAAEVLVDAGVLTEEERAMMLFRHAKAAALPDRGASAVRRNGRLIVKSAKFTPLRVRRVIERIASAEPDATDHSIDGAVAEELNSSGRLMQRAFAGLTGEQQAFAYSLLDVQSIGKCMLPKDAWRRHRPDHANPDCDVVAAGLIGHMLSELRASPELHFYNWLHPVWRDVTIEALMEDAASRRRFLELGDVGALMLALSFAGGESGTRTIPLIRLDEDWEAMQIRVPELLRGARKGSDYAYTQLTDAVRALARELPRLPSGLERLVELMLEEIREWWATAPRRMHNDDLRKYYELSGAIRPAVPGPSLDPLWEEYRQVLDAVEAPLLGHRQYGILRAFEFFALAEEHDPNSVRRHGYPETWKRQIEELLESAAVYLRSLAPDEKLIAEAPMGTLWDHGETVYDAWAFLSQLARMLPFGNSRATRLANTAKDLDSEIEATIKARRAAEPAEEASSLPAAPAGERAMSDGDLTALLADLA
jgi:conflict system STAND superfamily ATPase